MDANKILNAEFIDILFDERNKEYGAYELRKNYKKRLLAALLSTAAFALLIFVLIIAGRKFANAERNRADIRDINLAALKEDEAPKKIETPPPPQKVDVEKIKIDRVTPPKIVDDNQFDETKEVMEQDDITNVGKIKQEGLDQPDMVNPPKVENEAKVVEEPKKQESDEPFMKVEKEAQFPGGDDKWTNYVRREIERHMEELQEDGQSGTCEVQFIVDKEGNVSNVEALSMKGTKLAEVAVNAIKRGPKWIPAIQNGQSVKAWRKQKITFKVPDE